MGRMAIKPVTLRSWIKKDNGLPAYRVGKFWKFKKSELDEWIQSGKSADIENQKILLNTKAEEI